MPKATIDEFDLDVQLQAAQPEPLYGEKYPPPTIPLNCTTSLRCTD